MADWAKDAKNQIVVVGMDVVQRYLRSLYAILSNDELSAHDKIDIAIEALARGRALIDIERIARGGNMHDTTETLKRIGKAIDVADMFSWNCAGNPTLGYEKETGTILVSKRMLMHAICTMNPTQDPNREIRLVDDVKNG